MNIKNMKFLYIFLFLMATLGLHGQPHSLRINPQIALPTDSIVSKDLIQSINNFLSAAQQPNEENRFVLESEKLETFVLLDEINGVTKSKRYGDDYFYQPYLTNLVALKDSQYLIHVSYLGIHQDTALLKASFEFIAHKKENAYVFSSPLKKNTTHWKIKTVGNHTFHYQYSINQKKVKAYHTFITLFDTKLKVPTQITDYYCTNDIVELQKLIGVVYKSDYNGLVNSVWYSQHEQRKLIVWGNNNANFDHFDPHDLFHERLSLLVSRNKVNKPVDEGCAYLYGGSWGLSWKEIFKAFKEQIATNKNIDWKEIKENPVYFTTNGYKNSADYIVNALLIKKIEKEHGFAGVWELLQVGPFEKGNDKYYQTLEKLTGITRENYNAKIWVLINIEQ